MPEVPPLRIGINATALLSPRTGIGQYVYNLGREFLESDAVEPHFFYANHWSMALRAQPLPNISAVKAQIRRFVPKAYAVSRSLMQVRFTTGLWKAPVDLYHEPNYLAYRFAGKSVVTAHDASWIRYPETHPADRLAALDRYFPRSLEAASAVLTDCEFVKREMVELFGVPPEKIFPVLLGVSPEFFPRVAGECRETLAGHGLDFGNYVLSVGTLEPRKNIPALIDAYSMLPEHLQRRYPLVMVGMRGWLTSGLEARMKPLVEKGVVKPLGYVPDAEMPVIYSGAAAFAFPSLYEGFGLPPLEAMACGVPVVCSGTSSLPEVVGDAGVLVDPRDVGAIADSLHRILEDRGFAADLAQRGVQRAAGFTWARTAQQTIDVYRRVLGG
jgi:alpha-1,3-rhamnosyl/mannosyltransferase